MLHRRRFGRAFKGEQPKVTGEALPAEGRCEPFCDGRSRHRRAIGGDLSRQTIPGPFLDEDIDQRQPLVFVDRFRQQLLIAIMIETRILVTHATPPRPYVTTSNCFATRAWEQAELEGYQPLNAARLTSEG